MRDLFLVASYFLGLVLLLHFDHVVWFIVGIFLPFIPIFYTIYVAFEKVVTP